MENMPKQEVSSGSGIHQLTTLVKTGLSLIKDFLKLFFLEIELAKKSFMALCGAVVVIFILLISAWLCLLGALFLLLITLGFNSLSAFLILSALNLVLILFMLRAARGYIKNMGFPATRKQLTSKIEQITP